MDNNVKVILEMVSTEHLSKIQQKINQWITIGHIKSWKITPVNSELVLVEYIVLKSEV